MDFSRIMTLLSRVFLRKSIVKQNSPLLDLPICLLDHIFNVLQWPEKVALSQSCRELWYQSRQRCALFLREATAPERLEYLTMLANILPDHYLCAGCRVLHLVDPEDIPITECDEFGANLYRTPCPSPEPLWSRQRLHSYYAIAFRHVQLALRYSRMESVHKRYRASMMQQFTIINPRVYSIGLDIVLEPVIVRDRFILTARFEFYEGIEEVSYSTFLQTDAFFCPHHSIGTLIHPNDPFIRKMRSAFRRLKFGYDSCQLAYSCGRCPSDYSIVIKDKRLTVSVWYDLGTGVSPEDPYWRSHIWDEDNNQFKKGTEFPYEHGSIRRMCHISGT